MDGKGLLISMGREVRDARIACEMSQESVAELFGWGRDAISKLERGLINISFRDYMELMWFFREVVGRHHPVYALRQHYANVNKSLQHISG